MSYAKRSIDVVLQGRGKLRLKPSDYVSTGGEGVVYRVKNTVVKLYLDADKMIDEDMASKLSLLSKIKHPFIVRPQGLVTNLSDKPIGFYMSFVKGEPFPRVFTNDFRNRTGFTDDDASLLALRMQKAVQYAHDSRALMVDANEFNWIASLGKKDGPEPHIIDVDSWAIGTWPAKVIMPSIRDWHAKKFDQSTDWFSWGIVSFQLYTGIHPYKGTLVGFERGDLEGRMKANASVFRKGVRLNRAVRDFAPIPGPLLDWYKATFEDGERSIPPSPFQKGVASTKVGRVMRIITTKSGTLVYDKLFGDPKDKVIRIFPCGVSLLESGRLINMANTREIGKVRSQSAELIRVDDGWIKADWDNKELVFSYINAHSLKEISLSITIKSRALVRYENRLFVVTDNGLTEIKYSFLGKPVLSLGCTWGAMVNSTHWFDGVGIQDTLGATYLIAPFGDNACRHVRVRELDGLSFIQAKAGHRFISVIVADGQGEYHKFEFSFNRDYTTYTVWQSKTDIPDINTVILPKGVCATVVHDGEMTVFVPSTGTLNRVQDKDISTDMVFANWNNKVLYIQDGEVWSVRM